MRATLPEIGEIIEIKQYKLKELAHLYNNISTKTLKKWLEPFKEEIGERKGHYYSIPQVRVIFKKLGYPGILKVS